MADFPDERQLTRRARERLPANGRDAHTELFEGDDPMLSPADMRLLDALDSELERGGGDGVWGTDQYGIYSVGDGRAGPSLGLVCVYHPQITTDSVLRGADEIDDRTEERLNEALWRYAVRVATLVDEQLDEFVARSGR